MSKLKVLLLVPFFILIASGCATKGVKLVKYDIEQIEKRASNRASLLKLAMKAVWNEEQDSKKFMKDSDTFFFLGNGHWEFYLLQQTAFHQGNGLYKTYDMESYASVLEKEFDSNYKYLAKKKAIVRGYSSFSRTIYERTYWVLADGETIVYLDKCIDTAVDNGCKGYSRYYRTPDAKLLNRSNVSRLYYMGFIINNNKFNFKKMIFDGELVSDGKAVFEQDIVLNKLKNTIKKIENIISEQQPGEKLIQEISEKNATVAYHQARAEMERREEELMNQNIIKNSIAYGIGLLGETTSDLNNTITNVQALNPNSYAAAQKQAEKLDEQTRQQATWEYYLNNDFNSSSTNKNVSTNYSKESPITLTAIDKPELKTYTAYSINSAINNSHPECLEEFEIQNYGYRIQSGACIGKKAGEKVQKSVIKFKYDTPNTFCVIKNEITQDISKPAPWEKSTSYYKSVSDAEYSYRELAEKTMSKRLKQEKNNLLREPIITCIGNAMPQ